MNPTRRIMLAGMKGMILLLALAVASCAPAPATRTSTTIPQATKQQVLVAYGKLPLIFEANQGQTDPQVKFLSRGSGYTLFLTPTEAVLALREGASARNVVDGSPAAKRERGQPLQGTVLRMKLLGANPTPGVTGVEELRGRSNYFIGNDPAKWRANVPTYAKVEYRDVYPGVNLVYYGNQRQLEFDFIVAPGADPQRIRLGVEGADRLDLDAQGDLVVHTGGAQVRLQQPHVYQMANGVRQEIESRYVLNDHHQVEVWVVAYDTHKPLVIDPTLAYSTYLGGNSLDEGFGIAVDSLGQAYVTGVTASLDFPPTAGAFQSSSAAGEEAFVTKLNPTGAALVYSTYLGGTNSDVSLGIAVDSLGQAYVTGRTSSANFPTTAGAFQPSFPGGFFAAFVTRLNPTGAALVYSTYLGGTGGEQGFSIAVDAAGNAYVTGNTFSTNFPTTAGAFQPRFGGGDNDAFVTKLNTLASGSASLVYSTYLGGTSDENGFGIAVDSTGNTYVTGQTGSLDFPTTTGAFRPSFAGGFIDAFVTKLNPTGAALAYSTYLGGTGDEDGFGIAVDATGNAYVTGITFSPDFPTTAGTFQPSSPGGDAFVTKLGPTGAALVYSTYLGGTGSDVGFGIAVDSFGNAYVTGQTLSSDFPTTEGAFQTTFGGGGGFDAFLTKVNPAGAALVYSTYLGGTSDDFGLGIAVDSFGNAYVTGFTGSLDFPTLGAFQTTSGDGADAFVAKFRFATTNTRVGTNVVVQPVDATSGATPVTVTFANVTAAGDTTLTTSAAGPPPPAGFKLGVPPTYYELTTTASFSGDVTVCINYNTITFNNVASLKLFHFVDPNWVDATVSLDTATQIICGRVTSLSPFAIFELSIEPFAAFHARVEIEHERHKREFEVKGTFTLGAGSDGIHPDTEVVTLEVGTFSATIPKGSFRRHGHGTFKFEGLAGGARLEVKIQARGGN